MLNANAKPQNLGSPLIFRESETSAPTIELNFRSIAMSMYDIVYTFNLNMFNS